MGQKGKSGRREVTRGWGETRWRGLSGFCPTTILQRRAEETGCCRKYVKLLFFLRFICAAAVAARPDENVSSVRRSLVYGSFSSRWFVDIVRIVLYDTSSSPGAKRRIHAATMSWWYYLFLHYLHLVGHICNPFSYHLPSSRIKPFLTFFFFISHFSP